MGRTSNVFMVGMVAVVIDVVSSDVAVCVNVSGVVGVAVGVGSMLWVEGCLVFPTIVFVFQKSSGLVGSMEFHGFLSPDSLILSSKLSPNQILVDILGVDFLAVKAICWSWLWSFWRDLGM